MKVFAISDFHLSINNPKPMDIFGGAWDNYVDEILAAWEKMVSDEDIVLIAGDISWAMSLENALPDLEFISRLKGSKFLLRGNHDYWWKSISLIRAALPKKMYAVQNDAIKVGNIIVCGSRGWASPEGRTLAADDQKIFDREIIRMELSLQDATKKKAEGDKIIAMIHYPPFNSRQDDSPFTALFKKYGADAVVYGHLHGRESRIVHEYCKDGINYYLTSCDKLNNIPKLILEV